jgi:hypothetical protein
MELNGEGRRKETLRRASRLLEGNIKVDLREMGWIGINWIHLAQNTHQQCSIKFGKILE